MYDIFFAVYDIEPLKSAIKKRFPLAKFCIIDENSTNEDTLLDAQRRSITKMFWFVNVNYELTENFDLNQIIPTWDQKYVHTFKSDGVYLIPKTYHITKKEAEYFFFINKKEIDLEISKLRPNDIFFAIYDKEEIKAQIISQFPTAKFCIIDKNSTNEDIIRRAQERSLTKMFWFVNVNYELTENFNINFNVSEWDQKYVHTFKSDGVYLIPKTYHITKKEAEYFFFINKKEIDLEISRLKPNDIFFVIYNVEEIKAQIISQFPTAKFCFINENTTNEDILLQAQERSLTKMFWFVNVNYELTENFNVNFNVSEWDQTYVHTFKSDGVYLIPKSYHITKKESEYFFFVNKKEIDLEISRLKPNDIFFAIYDIEETKTQIRSQFPTAKFCIIDENNTLQDALLSSKHRSTTKMFWFIDIGVSLNENFNINFNVSEWDQQYVHVFKEEKTDTYDGVYLIPKSYHITKKESEYFFFINKKEIPMTICKFSNYDIFEVKNYDEYLEKKQKATTPMFYLVTSNLLVDNFNFDNQISKLDQDKVHVFKNGKYFDGICLFPKNKVISQREFNYRFFIKKIEIDIVASQPKPFDIVFISYSEPNADENYENLLKRFPNAKRIHGVKGIHQAHKKAATVVDTPMFWVVDGDAQLMDDFNFDYQVPSWDFDIVHVFRSKNPINGLEYGYGGVKLLPTQLTRDIDTNTVDMTTSISHKFKAVNHISNISRFNTDEFNTWKSAFRECVKLSSKIIVGQSDKETTQRLDIWCTEGEGELFGKFAIQGALAGKEFGFKYKDNPAMLSKINDWNWLEEQFQKNEELTIN